MSAAVVRHCGRMVGLSLVPMLLAGCVAGGAIDPIPLSGPGSAAVAATPATAEEADLWAALDSQEALLRTSGRRIADPELNAYVNGVVCDLVPDLCPSLRVYIVRQPGFNATMAPSGYMTVWSGLLLRVTNEAQLAAILGHEIAHFTQRHSLARFRRAKAAGNARVVGAVVGAALGVGGVGSVVGLVGLVGQASVQAFSRENEHEADRIGQELMAAAGYAPSVAAETWVQIAEEAEASGRDGNRTSLFASHPPNADRWVALRNGAIRLELQHADATARHADRYADAVGPFLPEWFADELAGNSRAAVDLLISRWEATGHHRGMLAFLRGERARQDGLTTAAIGHYQEATRLPDAPSEAFRALGLSLRERGDRLGSARAFAAYLDRSPGAPDRALIEHYITEAQTPGA